MDDQINILRSLSVAGVGGRSVTLAAAIDAVRGATRAQEHALRAILEIVQDHALFDGERFEARDLGALNAVGGDSAVITSIGIIAANALDGVHKTD